MFSSVQAAITSRSTVVRTCPVGLQRDSADDDEVDLVAGERRDELVGVKRAASSAHVLVLPPPRPRAGESAREAIWVDGAGWREQARARAAEHGFGQAELLSLQAIAPITAEEPDMEILAERLSGPSGLTGPDQRHLGKRDHLPAMG